MKSEPHLHRQVLCTCSYIHKKHCFAIEKIISLVQYLFPSGSCLSYRFLWLAFSMPAMHLVFLASVLVLLLAVLTSSSRTTDLVRPQIRKKPPRVGSSGGGFVQTTTMTTSLSGMHAVEKTDVMVDAYSISPTDTYSTYSSDTYPTDFHMDAMAPPGHTHGNYTLDYNECFFNVCECCPMGRDPTGAMGERRLPGPPGERGPLGEINDHLKNTFGCQKTHPSCCFLLLQGCREIREKLGPGDPQDHQDYLEPMD